MEHSSCIIRHMARHTTFTYSYIVLLIRCLYNKCTRQETTAKVLETPPEFSYRPGGTNCAIIARLIEETRNDSNGAGGPYGAVARHLLLLLEWSIVASRRCEFSERSGRVVSDLRVALLSGIIRSCGGGCIYWRWRYRPTLNVNVSWLAATKTDM